MSKALDGLIDEIQAIKLNFEVSQEQIDVLSYGPS